MTLEMEMNRLERRAQDVTKHRTEVEEKYNAAVVASLLELSERLSILERRVNAIDSDPPRLDK